MTSTIWPLSVRTAAKAYQSCIQSNNNQLNNGMPLVNALGSVMGGWPIITQNWTLPADNPIEAVIAQLESFYDVPTLLSTVVDTDWKFIKNNSLFVDQGTVALGSRQFYINPIFKSMIQSYTQLIATSAMFLANGSNFQLSQASAYASAQAVVNFEIKV